jgi:HlyD family secretion protein
MKKAAWVLILLALAAASVWGVRRLTAKKTVARAFRLVRIERGDLVQSVRASGVIQPIRLVLVGTQVNGPIQKLYVDYNDQVKAGDLVAQIDAIVYEARLAQDEANMGQALANVEQARAKLSQVEKELVRVHKLAEQNMVSQTEQDAAVANRDTLAAQLRVAEAVVRQGEAALRLSRANLAYTTIRSPVDGVVIERNVNEGQTVVASMTAQTLFSVATDLRQVQVLATVPEADIGKVAAGQRVTFTVDAHDLTFTGTVAQVRLAAVTVQNVVTYPVVILAANPDGKLLPSMTANIICEVAARTNVLKVANAALRVRADDVRTPVASGAEKRNGQVTGKEAPAGVKAGSARGDRVRGGSGSRLWLPPPHVGEPPMALLVSVGISDGASTEICEPTDLAEGQQVIAGVLESGAKQEEVVNPFAPKMPGNRPPPGR